MYNIPDVPLIVIQNIFHSFNGIVRYEDFPKYSSLVQYEVNRNLFEVVLNLILFTLSGC